MREAFSALDPADDRAENMPTDTLTASLESAYAVDDTLRSPRSWSLRDLLSPSHDFFSSSTEKMTQSDLCPIWCQNDIDALKNLFSS